jgi:hypothetical protein
MPLQPTVPVRREVPHTSEHDDHRPVAVHRELLKCRSCRHLHGDTLVESPPDAAQLAVVLPSSWTVPSVPDPFAPRHRRRTDVPPLPRYKLPATLLDTLKRFHQWQM